MATNCAESAAVIQPKVQQAAANQAAVGSCVPAGPFSSGLSQAVAAQAYLAASGSSFSSRSRPAMSIPSSIWR